MIKVVERRGKAHVFSLKDKSTFRLFAHETKELESKKVSDELLLAEKMGIIALIDIPKEAPKEVLKVTKKSGGTE